MAQLRSIPTLFLNGALDMPGVEAVERCMTASHLPPDHTMIWIDSIATPIHVEVEYGVGPDRIRVQADALTVAGALDDCVAQLVHHVEELHI
jgi:hypothetical protein